MSFFYKLLKSTKRIVKTTLFCVLTLVMGVGAISHVAYYFPSFVPGFIIYMALGAAILLFGYVILKFPKRLIYEVSLMFSEAKNILLPSRYPWWSAIPVEGEYQIVLGAIPLKNRGHDETLRSQNLCAVLSLVEDFEIETQGLFSVPMQKKEWKEKGIVQLHIPTRDFNPVSLKDIDRGVSFIERQRSGGGNIYVHCKAGRGRSATIVICYFMKYWKMSPEDALRHVSQHRPAVKLTAQQWKRIQEYGKKIF